MILNKKFLKTGLHQRILHWKMVQFSACPKDAVDLIKKKVSLILNTCGGDGCVREFSDLYLRKNKNI